MASVVSTRSSACAFSDAEEGLGMSSATEGGAKNGGAYGLDDIAATNSLCARIVMVFHRIEGEADSPTKCNRGGGADGWKY